MDCKVWLLKSRKRKVFSQERHGSFAFACSGSARWAVAAVEPSCTRAALSNSCVSCSLGFDRVQCRRLSKGQPASTPGQLLPPRRMACERKCDMDREGRSGNHLELRAHGPSADIERLKVSPMLGRLIKLVALPRPFLVRKSSQLLAMINDCNAANIRRRRPGRTISALGVVRLLKSGCQGTYTIFSVVFHSA